MQSTLATLKEKGVLDECAVTSFAERQTAHGASENG
jgi:hypothetical protein